MKSMDSVTVITIVLVLAILLDHLPLAGQPLHPPGHHRSLLPDLARRHRLPGLRRHDHLHVHQRLLDSGALRSGHRLLPLLDKPLPRGDGRHRPRRGPAVKTTVRAVGETIASSAGTVIVGLAMMVFAELGLYNTTGPAIAIGVAITLLAGLTLIPALLCVLGHHAFWPRKAAHVRDQGLWPRWAAKVVRHPVIALVVPVVVLVPLAWYGSGLARDFDMLGDLPKTDEARAGFDVLAEHMGAGNMRPLNVAGLRRDRASPRPRAWPASKTSRPRWQAADQRGRGPQRHRRLARRLHPQRRGPDHRRVGSRPARGWRRWTPARLAQAPRTAASSAQLLQTAVRQLLVLGGYLEQLACDLPRGRGRPRLSAGGRRGHRAGGSDHVGASAALSQGMTIDHAAGPSDRQARRPGRRSGRSAAVVRRPAGGRPRPHRLPLRRRRQPAACRWCWMSALTAKMPWTRWRMLLGHARGPGLRRGGGGQLRRASRPARCLRPRHGQEP